MEHHLSRTISTSLHTFLGKLCSQTTLTEEERSAVLAMTGKTEQLQTRDTFVWLGDKLTTACLVMEGLCGRVETPREDQRQITAIYIPGDMPDLYSAFQADATSKLEALTTLAILRIPHEQIRAIMRSHPALTEAFARYLVGDAIITNEWLVNVGSREAKAAVAHVFCEMAVRMGKAVGERFSFFFPLSQVQLSEVCGLSAVHINRSLGILRRAQLMHLERGQVHVANWTGLKQLAGFDTSYLTAMGPARVTN